MSCDCVQCKKDNILNGTLVADCAMCSTKLDINVKFQVMPDKTLVCEPCIAEHFKVCPNCRKSHKKTSYKTVTGNNNGTYSKIEVCEKCFTANYRACADCNEFFNHYDLMGHGDKSYCKPCFNKSYQACSHCGNVFPKGQPTRSIRGMTNVCDNCYNFYGPIVPYETKPSLNFHGIPPHYYGVELECELVNAKREERGVKAQEAFDLFKKDFVVLKEDGSLRCGFEICCQPATVPEHKNLWNPFFDKLPQNLHSFNTSNCGLHVHCSRKPLTLLTIAKIVVFVNDDSNQAFVELIAGRKANRYANYQKKKHSIVKVGHASCNRYDAVNLTNRDTIEFRIFKGTLKRESFYKALEFCDAIIKFCDTANNGITFCRSKQNFIDFVEKKQKDYPHLYAFICAKIFKKETKLTKQYGFAVIDESSSTKTNTQPEQANADSTNQ